MSNDINALIEQLKEAAEKATPGPWATDSAQGVISIDDMENECYLIADCGGPDDAFNSNFIALVNPENIKLIINALEAAQQRIAELESKQKWIGVEEAFPPFDRSILVKTNKEVIGEAVYSSDRYARKPRPRYERFGRILHSEITHWMPMPPAPEVDKS